MKPIHSYVVRVYRRDADALAGVVEDVQTQRTAPFRSLAELCEVLGSRQRFRRRPARRDRNGAASAAEPPADAPCFD